VIPETRVMLQLIFEDYSGTLAGNITGGNVMVMFQAMQ
jgi:hypothetical protein